MQVFRAADETDSLVHPYDSTGFEYRLCQLGIICHIFLVIDKHRISHLPITPFVKGGDPDHCSVLYRLDRYALPFSGIKIYPSVFSGVAIPRCAKIRKILRFCPPASTFLRITFRERIF